MTDNGVDLLVIGAGMAGCTAAARAATQGLSVCLVDVADDVGGSARYAGYVWTMPDHEVMAEQNPDGDPVLRRRLVDGFGPAVHWLREFGADVGPAQRILSYGRGHRFDTNQYVDLCRKTVADHGGEILLGTDTEELSMSAGAVVGAVVRPAGESTREIRARHTLIATGGFQADPELRARHLHPSARGIALRSNPHSRGGGHRLATAAGAALGPAGAGFYGHLVPSEISFTDGDYVQLALYYSEHALLFNLENKRFTDESLADHLTTMELLAQPEARGLLIGDARVHRDWMTTAYVEGAIAPDKFALASKRGGRVGVAESLDELQYLPEEWGYDGAVIAAEIESYNARVRDGSPSVPRALDPMPLDEPPYYVIETVPAVTFPFVGLRTDEKARVTSESGDPIPGLLAAGSDTGGLWYRAYGGGLATALVYGLAAADTAASA